VSQQAPYDACCVVQVKVSAAALLSQVKQLKGSKKAKKVGSKVMRSLLPAASRTAMAHRCRMLCTTPQASLCGVVAVTTCMAAS
jgi:hypothetical protein